MMPKLFRMKCFTLFLVCGSAIGAAGGQAINSGDIRGTVTDSTGALLPDVTVTVVNVNTGVSKVLTTNKDGLYDTSSVVVGTYSVSFEKPGFAQFERSSITLEAGTSTVNAALKVGSTSEEVVVNTDLPLLDTESGSQQTTFEAKSMAALANVGQDWENFTILMPGSSGANAGNAQNQVNPGQTVSANGNLPYSNVLADGASSTLSHSQNSNVDVFENVAELQISDSAFSAQYGVGGIIFNQISKGGTSKFHGTAYDYFQSSEFNALGYNYSGSKVSIPYQRYNNFGGSIGGPVALPLLKLKQKAFFYFNYDQIVNHAAGSNPTNSIPTSAVMAGDFTGQQLIYDPTTQTIGHDANGNPYPIRQSFLSEYGANAVPTGMIDKLAANFQALYPTSSNHIGSGHFIQGNTPTAGGLVGITQGNFISSVPSSSPQRKYFGRFDYDVNSRNRITASIQQQDVPNVYPSPVTACPIGCQSGDVDNYVSQISDVWTISPKIINEVRLGYTYQGNFFADLALGNGYASKLGWQYAKADDLPAIQFVTNYPYAWIQPSSNAVYKEHVFDPSDVVTMIRGKHVLHFGGEFAFYQDNSTAWGNTNAGAFQFSGQYTQNWTVDAHGIASPNTASGTDYADFLLGDAQNWSASVSPEYGARIKDPQVFVQDDYKVRPNLTLNIGLRYQIRHGWSEVHNNESTYDPTINNPANNTPGAYWYGTTHTNGRTQLQSNKYNTVLPRVGFSWLVRPDMTIRGGFGEYAYNLSLDTYGTQMGTAIAASGNYADSTNGITPATQLGGTGTIYGTSTPLPYSASSTSPTRFNGQNVGYTQYDTPNPGIYQWNLGIQQAIGNNLVFDLAYVASHGFNLQFVTDLNQIPTADLSSNDAQFAPNPNFHQINGSTNNGISNYNSLQAQLNRRLSHGVSFGFNYTWSHFLDDFDSSGWGGRNGPVSRQYADARSNYSNSNFDVRNAFKGRVVYQLPFGKGRQFLNHNWLLDEVLGGYQVSSTMQLTSGNPFSIFATGANTFAQIGGNNAPYPNYVGSGHNLKGVPGGRNAYEWYNPANFTLPASGTFGNVRRNALYGPGLEVFNLSAAKYFDVHESVRMQLRLDANNAFNHGSLGQPNGNLSTVTTPGAVYTGNGINGANTGPNSGQIQGNKVNGRQLQAGVRVEF